MIKASSPGKIYLFGEHSVVYGYPAIACAINKRTEVTISEIEGEEIIIEPRDLEFKSLRVHYGEEKELSLPQKELNKLEYIKETINKFFEIIDEKKGIKIKIRSELPPGGGLGSSAAVVVSTLYALNKLFNTKLNKEKIAEISYQIEKKVQGNASPCDTFTSTMGGLTKVKKGEELKKKETPNLPLVIGSTKEKSNTKELVQEVKSLKQKYPSILTNLFETIAEITDTGEKKLKKGNIKEIGELMNINQGILDSIGVNNLKLSRLIYSARKNGAQGAKITGAGGGGCMVALGKNKTKIANAIKLANGEPIKTEITNQGVISE